MTKRWSETQHAAAAYLRGRGSLGEQNMNGQCCEGFPHMCPGCDRVMSHREAAEQGACNDCHEGWTG
jgi:ribosomal protein L37AE/L43A